MMKRWVWLAVAFMAVAGPAQAAEPVTEPADFRLEDYRTPTPTTLKGATVVDSEEAYRIWKAGGTLFIDVLPRAPKPANLPAGTIWRDKPRKDIPGSVWLPNVGYGALALETDQYFRRNLTAVTGGDFGRRLLFYCLKDCWMSWNAAKRAMEYGYTQVIWYPEGTDGWGEMDNPVELKEPAP
jgi:PQQ-dependent catabolism-associated CXXCW motif protein